MKDEKILISCDGPDSNVIKLKPPMVFDQENADEFIHEFDRLLKELGGKMTEDVKCEKNLAVNTVKEFSEIKIKSI